VSFKKETIGDVVELITNGVNCKQNKEGNGVKISRIETIANREINYQKTGFSKLTEADRNKYKLIKGDILFSHINSPIHVGKVAIYNGSEDLYHGVNLLKLRVKNHINPYYFKYFLDEVFQSGYWRRTSKQSVNQASVNQTDIKKIDFLYPILSEQQRIVAKLDVAFAEIDKGISQTQKSIENTNLLFEEKIKQYFIHNITNSPIVKLSDISEYFNGLTYSPKDVSEDGLIVLRSGNIQNGKMKYQDIKRVNKKIKDKLYVKPTDILICSRNGSQRLIGKSSLIGEIKEPMTFGTFMMILRSEHNKYLQWFIKSKLFKKQILKGENTMINQITRYMLDDISLPFPDKKNYTKIAKELEELDGHIRMLNKILNIKIDNFKALKSSILQQELLDEVA
jgi:restriction endonuclease S subunit|tara:strand:- start:329 stop:1513 length:1185 start_codon:yes stop_codon:yes gene_type:complete